MSADRTIRGAATRSRPGEPTYLVFCDVDETLIHCKSLLEFLDHYFAERYGSHGRRHAAGVRAQLAAVTAADGGGRRPMPCSTGPGEVSPSRRSGGRGGGGTSPAGLPAASLSTPREPRCAGTGAQGAELALVSGSFAAVLDPLAEECGAGHILCTRPVVVDGVLTGEVDGAPVIGEGKRRAVRALLARHPHVDPADCHAYGDHVSDLPMLLEVGHPTVVGSPPHCWRGCGLPTARSSCERAVAVAGVRCPGKGCRYTLEQTKYLHEGL